MTDLRSYAAEQLSRLLPDYEEIDFRANISDSSYSVEFFVTADGKRMQCYEMADEGIIDEDELNACTEAIANYARKTADFKKGEVNKYSFTLN